MHKLDYCEVCEMEIVRCGTCDNNCCNGGYGYINKSISDERCPDCPKAYALQTLYWQMKEIIEMELERFENAKT